MTGKGQFPPFTILLPQWQLSGFERSVRYQQKRQRDRQLTAKCGRSPRNTVVASQLSATHPFRDVICLTNR